MSKTPLLLVLAAVQLLGDTSSVTLVIPPGQLYSPAGIAVDAAGAIYVADTGNHRVLKVQGGTTTIVAGTGSQGFQGDGGPATAALLGRPESLALDNQGNLYIGEALNYRIRRVTASTGIISTLAGNGVYYPISGDGGPAVLAAISYPRSIAVEPATGAVYVTDGWSSIRRIDPATGFITLVAGNYTQASRIPDGYPPLYVDFPSQLTFDASGSLVFAERTDIRRIDRVTNITSTLAGWGVLSYDDGFLATDTSFENSPVGSVALSPDGTIYVGQATRIRRVDPLTGRVMTVTSVSAPCTGGNSAPASTIGVCPYALATNPAGELLVSQSGQSTVANVVKIAFNRAASTVSLSASPSPSNQGQSVLITALVSPSTASGRVFLYDGASEIGTMTLGTGGAAVMSTATLAAGARSLRAVYEGNLDLQSSQSTILNHTVRASTTASLAATAASNYGDAVQLNAAITQAPATGTVEFWDGAVLLGSASVNGGTATFSGAGLSVGVHSLLARYTGNSTYAPSNNSAPVTHTVSKASPTITLASSLNPSAFAGMVTFTASLSRTGATGQVQFFDGGQLLGSGIGISGQATWLTNSLAVGSHSITAYFPGDQNFNASTSPALTQTVGKASTTTTIASSSNPAVRNQSVTFTVVVSSGTPSGSVQILDGATVLATVALTNGTATYTTSSLSVGIHTIKAKYLGSASHLASESAVLSQVIRRK